MCSCPMSSCTPTPPSRSSTAPRCPRSWSAPAARAGPRRARADRPRQRLRRDGVRAVGPGARPARDPRRRADARRRPPPDAARRGRARWRNLCRLRDACACAHTRGRAGGRPRAGRRRAARRVARTVHARVGSRRAARARGAPGARRTRARRRAPRASRAADPAARRPAVRSLRRRPRGGARLPQRLRDAGRARRAVAARCCATPSGATRLRVELQRPYLRDDRARNRRLAALARELGVRCVATGNVHAHARARAPAAGRARRGPRSTRRSTPPSRCAAATSATCSRRPAAMAARFAADHPDAVAETARLADRLRFDLTQRPRLPLSRRRGRDRRPHAGRALPCALSTSATPTASRRAIRARGASARLERGAAHHRRARPVRLLPAAPRHARAGARGRASRCAGRTRRARCCRPAAGAAPRVSSIVCYLTGLSHVDPVANDLFLGRFLNEELTALPDIDLDFPRDVRAALIPRIHERYGTRPLGARRRLPDLPRARRDPRAGQGARPAAGGDRARRARLGGLVGARRRAGRRDRARRASGSRRAAGRGSRGWPNEAHGLPRHLSQHSGGMVVATRPLIDCCPIVPAAMEGRQMVQWDKDSCADAGFLKIDLLGLGMLSAVERAVEDDRRAARRAHRPLAHPLRRSGRPTTRSRAPRRPASSRSRAARRWPRCCARARERCRTSRSRSRSCGPGRSRAARSTPTSNGCQRLRADPDFEVPYEHPSLVEPLRETLGTIIFQDQVIEVAMAFAGFSAGEAEGLRRAMSRKRSEAAIEAHHRAFVAGAVRDARRERGAGRARLRRGARLLRLRLPEGARRRLRPARLPVDVAARPLRRRSSCARC